MIGLIIALGVASYFYWISIKNGKNGWKYGLLSFFAYVVPFTIIFDVGFNKFVNYYQIIESEQDAFRTMAGLLTIAVILFLLSEVKKRIVYKSDS